MPTTNKPADHHDVSNPPGAAPWEGRAFGGIALARAHSDRSRADRISSPYVNGSPLRSSTLRVTLTFMVEVTKRRRGTARISSKNQITIPADALRSAGLEAGDRVVAHADGAGRVILEREHDVVAEFAGALTGAYLPGELDDLRSEWD